MDIADNRRPQDGRYTIRVAEHTVDMRVSAVPAREGEKIVIRLLDRHARLPSLRELGMPEAIREAFAEVITQSCGFIVVCKGIPPATWQNHQPLRRARRAEHAGTQRLHRGRSRGTSRCRRNASAGERESRRHLLLGAAFALAPRSERDHGGRNARCGNREHRRLKRRLSGQIGVHTTLA